MTQTDKSKFCLFNLGEGHAGTRLGWRWHYGRRSLRLLNSCLLWLRISLLQCNKRFIPIGSGTGFQVSRGLIWVMLANSQAGSLKPPSKRSKKGKEKPKEQALGYQQHWLWNWALLPTTPGRDKWTLHLWTYLRIGSIKNWWLTRPCHTPRLSSWYSGHTVLLCLGGTWIHTHDTITCLSRSESIRDMTNFMIKDITLPTFSVWPLSVWPQSLGINTQIKGNEASDGTTLELNPDEWVGVAQGTSDLNSIISWNRDFNCWAKAKGQNFK